MSKTKRKEVYVAIDTEREYQDNLPPSRSAGRNLTQAEFFPLIDIYLARAKSAWVGAPGAYVEDAQSNIRKIAALCVRCMEQYGAPLRENAKKEKK